jgi:two-component system, cell cycle sensor histidine kinase and response regulator CckA
VEQAFVTLAPVAAVAKPQGGPEAILVVEDDSSLRWLTCQILQQLGYSVLEAPDPAHALALAKERGAELDLMISDVIMPGLNGRQLTQQVRLLYPHLKVLLMSGYTAEIVAQGDGNEAALPFLEKPFTPEALGRKVRELLDRDGSASLPKGA